MTVAHPGQVVPNILLVRVQTASGPYAVGDDLTVAFNDPDVGRIAAHESARADVPAAPAPLAAPALPIPTAVQVVVTLGAEPYAPDDVLALWFVDPRFARITTIPGATHANATGNGASAATHGDGSERGASAPADAMGSEAGTLARANAARPSAVAPTLTATSTSAPAHENALAMVRLHWSGDRVRRFVQVVDRLFTVDRLGWYRHALAMRLLVPDEIRCGDPARDATAAAALQALRDAAVETLGGPLLEAFMPNFSVTAEWLDALDVPAGARSLAQLRTALESIDLARAAPIEFVPEPECTVGSIAAADLSATAGLSLDATLPVFIPHRSSFPHVSERLAAYRHALLELFAQTARSAKLVRLTQMAEPCHALDDRLWHLVGTVGESFGGLAPG